MPFMFIKTNQPISDEQEMALKTTLGKAIELVPNKSEAVLMIEMQDKARLWLRGEQPPMAFVKVSLYANPRHTGYPELTHATTTTARHNKHCTKISLIELQHAFNVSEEKVRWILTALLDRDNVRFMENGVFMQKI